MTFKMLALRVQGYKKIDRIQGLWKHSTAGLSGVEINIADYSFYDVYYNSRKDKYKILMSGFKPFQHYLGSELQEIVAYLNWKPHTDVFNHTIHDYFEQKEELMNFISTGYNEITNLPDSEYAIVKFELTVDRETVMNLRSNAPEMKTAIQAFKKEGLAKGEEVYEEVDNILITSSGYYVCTLKSNLSFKDQIEDDEDEED